jgi:hypothetical protein
MPCTYGQNRRGDRRTLADRSARPAARHAADVADFFWPKLSVLMEIKTFVLLFEIFGEEEVTFQNLKNIGTQCKDTIKQRVMQRMTAARWRQNIGADHQKVRQPLGAMASKAVATRARS